MPYYLVLTGTCWNLTHNFLFFYDNVVVVWANRKVNIIHHSSKFTILWLLASFCFHFRLMMVAFCFVRNLVSSVTIR